MTIYQLGLICNIVGTLVIAFYGLPVRYYAPDGGTFVTINKGDGKGKKFNVRKRIIAWAGIVLLLVGFALQFACSFATK